MKFFVSAGEVSGDLHLSYIISAMKKADNTVQIYGAAGSYSRKAGADIIQDISELSIMGFTEILKKISFLKKKMREYLDFIKKEKIDRVILVDYGGFNLRFLEELKKECPNVIVYYYIPPKLWVWGKSRIKKLIKADHILVIFPWEVDFYKKNNINVVYYGNPFVDKYQPIERTNQKILLLPGSRKQEITSLSPVFSEIIKNRPKEKFVLKLSSMDDAKWLDQDFKKYENLEITADRTLSECVKVSKIAICASGTVTLELSLLGIPAIVVYKTGTINAFIVKHFIPITYVSLPNITLDKEVYPELLQDRCTDAEIEKEMDDMLNDQSRKVQTDNDIKRIRVILQGNTSNVVDSYAKYLLK